MQDLGLLLGDLNARDFGIGADGSVVVSSSTSATGARAFAWTPALYMVDLQTYLVARGMNLSS